MLYLVRHAHAVDAAVDISRPLSDKGRRQIRRLGAFLRKSGALLPAEIWHSPLVRSRQTAEQLAKRLELEVPLRETAGLEPDDDPQATARRAGKTRRPLAIVGHEPQLSMVASLLVTGAADPVIFTLKKSGVIALERAGTRWVVRWQLSPELFG